jgi:acyl-[acyl carrier protein]--UDP-N-acetylglucosamine O-acyltransferase
MEAFKIFRDPGLNLKQAVRKIEQEIEMLDEIRYLIDFIGKSTRGITT